MTLIPKKSTTISQPICRDCGVARDDKFVGNRCHHCHRRYYQEWSKQNKARKSKSILPCPLCGSDFVQTRRDRLFCTNLCRDRYRYAVSKGNTNPTIANVTKRPYRVKRESYNFRPIEASVYFTKQESLKWIGEILAREKNDYLLVSFEELMVYLIGHYNSIGGAETKVGKPSEQLQRMWHICKLWYKKQMGI